MRPRFFIASQCIHDARRAGERVPSSSRGGKRPRTAYPAVKEPLAQLRFFLNPCSTDAFQSIHPKLRGKASETLLVVGGSMHLINSLQQSCRCIMLFSSILCESHHESRRRVRKCRNFSMILIVTLQCKTKKAPLSSGRQPAGVLQHRDNPPELLTF